MRDLGVTIVAALILATAALESTAAGRADRFAPRVQVGDRTARLNGTGLCEWGFFAIDLYYAALYLEKPSSDPRVVIDSKQAKRVHLRFVRALTRSQLQQAYTAAVRVNAGKDLPRYQARLAQLTAAMEDVRDGDSLIFDHLPGRGIEVRIKQKLKCLIKGDDFARLFFTLYFGPKPPDTNLKRGMLGRHRRSAQ